MHVELMFPKDYLASADLLVHGPQKVRIRKLVQENLQTRDGKKERKWVVLLHGTKKKWVLNITNARIIAEMYGAESDDWVDKEVTLYAAKVQAFGKTVDGIRVQIGND